MHQLGLALSGGGSRAIAFHRGTLRALDELGLIDAIDVVLTVSGDRFLARPGCADELTVKPPRPF